MRKLYDVAGSEVSNGTEDLLELGKKIKFHIKLRNINVYFTPLLNEVAIFLILVILVSVL